MIALEQSGMSKKKDRAFFICPRWNEVADTSRLCGVGHDDADPWQREKPDRDQGGAARRSIDAPQGIAGRAPGVGVDVRRRCLYRGPAHRSIAVNRGGDTPAGFAARIETFVVALYTRIHHAKAWPRAIRSTGRPA